jgi:hypothetical protein
LNLSDPRGSDNEVMRTIFWFDIFIYVTREYTRLWVWVIELVFECRVVFTK